MSVWILEFNKGPNKYYARNYVMQSFVIFGHLPPLWQNLTCVPPEALRSFWTTPKIYTCRKLKHLFSNKIEYQSWDSFRDFLTDYVFLSSVLLRGEKSVIAWKNLWEKKKKKYSGLWHYRSYKHFTVSPIFLLSIW